jgi:hypothetical protein
MDLSGCCSLNSRMTVTLHGNLSAGALCVLRTLLNCCQELCSEVEKHVGVLLSLTDNQ